MNESADLTPTGIAQIVSDFLDALDLRDVVLVGNDSGGAISQMVVTSNPERISQLVLTSCDGFEIFPPRMFQYLSPVSRIPGGMYTLAQSMRLGLTRRLPIAYGALTNEMPEGEVMNSYVRPVIESAGVRHDLRKFLKDLSPQYTMDASRKLKNFDRPVLLAWDDEDRFFKFELAERLAAEFPNSRLEKIENSRTFVPDDQPQKLVELIREFVREPAVA